MEIDRVTGFPLVTDLPEFLRQRLEAYPRLLVCYLDCTALTEWNDAYGWPAGDELLRTFAERFEAMYEQQQPRASQLIRLIGDAFAICQPTDAETDVAITAENLHALADKIMADASGNRVGLKAIWHIVELREIHSIPALSLALSEAASVHRQRTALKLHIPNQSKILQRLIDHCEPCEVHYRRRCYWAANLEKKCGAKGKNCREIAKQGACPAGKFGSPEAKPPEASA